MNGCGAEGGADVPDFFVGAPQFGPVFTDACDSHDRCYGTLGASKAQCDSNLNADMIASADAKIPEPYRTLYGPQVAAQAWAYSQALQWEAIAPFTSVPAFDGAQWEASCRGLSADAHEVGC